MLFDICECEEVHYPIFPQPKKVLPKTLDDMTRRIKSMFCTIEPRSSDSSSFVEEENVASMILTSDCSKLELHESSLTDVTDQQEDSSNTTKKPLVETICISSNESENTSNDIDVVTFSPVVSNNIISKSPSIKTSRTSLKRQCKERISLLDYNPAITIRAAKRTKSTSSRSRSSESLEEKELSKVSNNSPPKLSAPCLVSSPHGSNLDHPPLLDIALESSCVNSYASSNNISYIETAVIIENNSKGSSDLQLRTKHKKHLKKKKRKKEKYTSMIISTADDNLLSSNGHDSESKSCNLKIRISKLCDKRNTSQNNSSDSCLNRLQNDNREPVPLKCSTFESLNSQNHFKEQNEDYTYYSKDDNDNSLEQKSSVKDSVQMDSSVVLAIQSTTCIEIPTVQTNSNNTSDKCMNNSNITFHSTELNSVTETATTQQLKKLKIDCLSPCLPNKQRKDKLKKQTFNWSEKVHLASSAYHSNVSHEAVQNAEYAVWDNSQFHEQNSANYYLNQATDLKDQADKEENNMVQALQYVEAILYFIQYGHAVEQTDVEKDLVLAIYKETLILIKCISQKFDQLYSSSCPNVDDKLTALSLRCQSHLYFKMYQLRRHEIRNLHRSISVFRKSEFGSSPISNSPLYSSTKFSVKTSQISPPHQPSPNTLIPSPAGSVASVSSQSSGYSGSELGWSSSTVPSTCNTPAHLEIPVDTVSVPRNVYKMLQQESSYLSNLHLCHDLWEQAEILCSNKHSCEFFSELDLECGCLSLHSPVFTLINYIKKGLYKLKYIT